MPAHVQQDKGTPPIFTLTQDTRMASAPGLDRRLEEAVDEYGGLLRALAGALRSAGAAATPDEQAALVARLDAVFAADRGLQDVLAAIGALDVLAAQVREARTDLAMAEADVHAGLRDALADVRAAVAAANAARRRVARLSGVVHLCRPAVHANGNAVAGTPGKAKLPSETTGTAYSDATADANGSTSGTPPPMDRGSPAVVNGKNTLTAGSIPPAVALLAALALRLAQTGGPPRDWQPGSPLRAHRPPCPTEDMMRCGALFRHTNLGERHAEASAAPAPAGVPPVHPDGVRLRRQSADLDALPEAAMFLDLDLNPHL